MVVRLWYTNSDCGIPKILYVVRVGTAEAAGYALDYYYTVIRLSIMR